MKRFLFLGWVLFLLACTPKGTVIEEVKEPMKVESRASQGVEMILFDGKKRAELSTDDMRMFRTFMKLLGEEPNGSFRLRNYDNQVTRNGKEIIGFHFTPQGDLFVRYQEKEFSLSKDDDAAVLLRELYDEVEAIP